jgi:hypothetical protein
LIELAILRLFENYQKEGALKWAINITK